MGVSKKNHELQLRLDQFIDANRTEVQKLLDTYGVPQLSLSQTPSQAGR
jgi:hypothetical protein